MPKYVVERELPGAGLLTGRQLQETAAKSRAVLREIGPDLQWVESYVTENKIFCVYIAPNEEAVRKHAEKGGFPCNAVREIKCVIDPTTAES